MNVLFICNQNKNRSKTAEKLFSNKFNTKSSGLFNKKPVSVSDLEWADVVVVMEDFQRTEIGKRFPKQCLQKKIVTLGIEDKYRYDQPELIDELRLKVNSYLD